MKIEHENGIVQKGHKALAVKAKYLNVAKITNQSVQDLIKLMFEVLSREQDGVALAAPQIGAELRMFVVSPLVFKNLHPLEPLVYINPEITRVSRKKESMSEGCLSVRGVMGKTHRHQKVSVTAYNEKGQKFKRDGTGLLAQIFQHEIDHLNGILFDDHAIELEKYDHTQQKVQ